MIPPDWTVLGTHPLQVFNLREDPGIVVCLFEANIIQIDGIDGGSTIEATIAVLDSLLALLKEIKT